MSFCIKKYLVFSLRKSNNTKYYRTGFQTVLFLRNQLFKEIHGQFINRVKSLHY